MCRAAHLLTSWGHRSLSASLSPKPDKTTFRSQLSLMFKEDYHYTTQVRTSENTFHSFLNVSSVLLAIRHSPPSASLRLRSLLTRPLLPPCAASFPPPRLPPGYPHQQPHHPTSLLHTPTAEWPLVTWRHLLTGYPSHRN